jgi:hypothetical protein
MFVHFWETLPIKLLFTEQYRRENLYKNYRSLEIFLLDNLPWRWRQQVLRTRLYLSIKMQSVISEKTLPYILIQPWELQFSHILYREKNLNWCRCCSCSKPELWYEGKEGAVNRSVVWVGGLRSALVALAAGWLLVTAALSADWLHREKVSRWTPGSGGKEGAGIPCWSVWIRAKDRPRLCELRNSIRGQISVASCTVCETSWPRVAVVIEKQSLN